MTERTLSIVKPDAVERGLIGEIMARFEKNGLKIVGAKLLWLSRPKAREFYFVHHERPFFNSLVDYMVSGPIFAMILEGEDAVARNRALMGATDPGKAVAGTIRKDLGQSIERNSVHGSDAQDTARAEIAHFFSALEICDRS